MLVPKRETPHFYQFSFNTILGVTLVIVFAIGIITKRVVVTYHPVDVTHRYPTMSWSS